MGFFFYVWWKRLPPRLMADVTLIGLLVAFSIGRIGCTVVSDHIGAEVDPSKWYAALAMEYPTNVNREVAEMFPGRGHVLMWNLGLVEFLYLIPVNLFILGLAFRPARPTTDAEKAAFRAKNKGVKAKDAPEWAGRQNAGMVTVLVGMLYAPVRFFMDFLRPEYSDPRHFGLTFAQWISILAFGGTAWFAYYVFKNGEPANPVTQGSGEAQRRLKLILKEDPREEDPKAVEKIEKEKAAEKSGKGAKSAEPAKKDPKLAVTVPEDDELAKEALAAKSEEGEGEAEKAETQPEQDGEKKS
jgi:hypothetical protein